MTDYILVQTAIDSEEAAQQIAEGIVSKRLAACCWVSGPINSTYWWKGKMEQSKEWVCTFKSRADLYEKLEDAIKKLHSYDVPDITAIPLVAGSEEYLNWIRTETHM